MPLALASAPGPASDAGQGESSLDSILTASAFQKLQPGLLTHLESGGLLSLGRFSLSFHWSGSQFSSNDSWEIGTKERP